jgi:tetratricopeptide (TPR) repeat protein
VRKLNPFSFLGKRARAGRANERGRELGRVGRSEDAIREYERASRLDPTWSVPLYNRGLLHKYSGQWEDSLRCNHKACELNPDDQGAWWNLAIAATALGRWEIARSAWRRGGLAVPDGNGPVDFPCGRAPVRLNPDTDGEVVWADRLDPARAVIRSIPLPESGFRFDDIVLNDGAATGYRQLGGREVPVFNCLALLKASSYSTWVAQVEPGSPADGAAPSVIDLLIDLAATRDLVAEDWSTSIRMLCKACSEGRPHAEHDQLRRSEVPGPHRVGIAARDAEQVRSLVEEWTPRAGRAKVLSVDVALSAG